MEEQIDLFNIEETYNLANLKQICYEFVKKKYTRVDCEDYDEFMEFLDIEAKYEYIERLRKIADNMEKELEKRQNY